MIYQKGVSEYQIDLSVGKVVRGNMSSFQAPALAELNKLKNIQNSLENAQLQFIELCCKEAATSHDFLNKLNNDSSTECQLSHEQLLSMKDQMENLKAKIHNSDASLPTEPDTLRNELVELKDSIENFKVSSKRRLEDLKSDERNITEELRYYEQLFATFTKPLVINEEPTFIKRSILQKSIECPEVKNFDQFLRDNHGHTQGWTAEDHTVFLKIKDKYKNLEKVSEKVHKIFPDMSFEDIQEHYEWHEEYCKLKTKQNDSIQQWKASKLIINKTKTKDVIEVGKNKKYKLPVPSTEETKTKLLAWKEEKRQRQEQECLVQEMSEQFHRQMEIMKVQKNYEIKEKVDRWRAIKAAEKRAIEVKRREEELKTRAFKSMLANHFIREFQIQDTRFIKKMQNCKINKTESNNTLRRSNNNKVQVDRDPSRLLKPTKTWIHKMEKPEKLMKNLGQCNLNLNSIQKLKAPDWRK